MYVGRTPSQCDLNGGRAPRYEPESLSFSEAMEGFVDLRWGDVGGIGLDDVEDGYVAGGGGVAGVGGDHDVVVVAEAAHYVKDGGFSYGRGWWRWRL